MQRIAVIDSLEVGGGDEEVRERGLAAVWLQDIQGPYLLITLSNLWRGRPLFTGAMSNLYLLDSGISTVI